MQINALATRYDFTRPYDGSTGWQIEARNGSGRVIADGALDLDLDECVGVLVGAGWQVSRWEKHFLVRAWRGDNLPITRIDLRYLAGQWWVQKWLAGWSASTEPTRSEVKPQGWDVRTALGWLNDHGARDHADFEGWRVQNAGAQFYRAWHGPVMPVRTARQIVKLRDQLRDWRNGLVFAEKEPWRAKPRPTWLPEDLDPAEVERGKLDLAYLL